VICTWPGCTGVHDNNRYSELCPRSRRLKALKDERYQAQTTVQIRRYLLGLDRRRPVQVEAFEILAADCGDPRHLAEAVVYRQMAGETRGIRVATSERFLNRPKRERAKVPTICTRPISVAQLLLDTRNPARTLGRT
jgi:hypothetical protein